METAQLLKQRRETVLSKWFDVVLETYPPDTTGFLAKQKDRFRNPVGHAITEALETIFDQVVSTMDAEELKRALDGVVRIRSVQDFSPSQAVAFVLRLKYILKEVLDDQLDERDPKQLNELARIDSRIDNVVLLAFDKYMECREQLHEIRYKEIKDRSIRLLDRVNVKPGISQQKGEPVDDEN